MYSTRPCSTRKDLNRADKPSRKKHLTLHENKHWSNNVIVQYFSVTNREVNPRERSRSQGHVSRSCGGVTFAGGRGDVAEDVHDGEAGEDDDDDVGGEAAAGDAPVESPAVGGER